MLSRIESIPKRLVLIFSFFCAALVVMAIGYSTFSYNQDLLVVSKRYQNDLSRAYDHSITQHQLKLSSIATLFKQDPGIIESMTGRDRVALYKKVKFQFDALKSDNGVAAIYFYTPTGENFLRIHQPEKHGDTLTRYTLQSAMRTGIQATGIESEFINQPLLSVVQPWRKDGEILGYIEVATQLMHILNEMSNIYQVGLLFAIEKKNLQSNNQFPDATTIAHEYTLEETQKYLLNRTENQPLDEHLISIIDEANNDDLVFYDILKKNQLVSTIPLQKIESKNTSKIFFVVSPESKILNKGIPFYLTLLVSSIITILTLSIYFYYGRHIQIRLEKHDREKENTSKIIEELKNYEKENNHLKTEIVEQQHDLEESQKRYQTLFEKTTDALLLIDGHNFIDCNQATLDMLGYPTKQELYNIHPSLLSPEKQPDGRESSEKANEMIQIAFQKGSHRFEWEHIRKNGEVFPVEVLLTSIPYGEKNLLYTVWRDISERKKAEAEIEYRAHYDALTELPNRNLLYEHLKTAYATAKSKNIYHALLFLDLDRFKNVNDSMGHSVGDDLLISCAKRIKSLLRQDDLLARFGGDEFVILLNDLGPQLQKANFNAERIAETIRQSFQTPIQTGTHELQVTLSAGITTFPLTDETVEDVLKYADVAMYKAKDSGRNKTAFFVSSMQEDILRRLNIERDLRAAMERNEIYLEYQPQYDGYGDIVGIEALARWKHPNYGMVSPEEFVSVAEDTGQIGDLGNYIFQTACAEMSKIYKETHSRPRLSINVSPRQLTQAGLIPAITSIINHFELKPEYITLEITEHVVIENFSSIKHKLYELKNLGLQISLDDFGTGYSSLSYLQQLPLSELKIDRSFVMNLEANSNETHLVKTIIEIGHEFDLSIVAEGVETLYQLNYLKKLNCNHYQGYYLSKPLSPGNLISLINKKQTKRISR